MLVSIVLRASAMTATTIPRQQLPKDLSNLGLWLIRSARTSMMAGCASRETNLRIRAGRVLQQSPEAQAERLTEQDTTVAAALNCSSSTFTVRREGRIRKICCAAGMAVQGENQAMTRSFTRWLNTHPVATSRKGFFLEVNGQPSGLEVRQQKSWPWPAEWVRSQPERP